MEKAARRPPGYLYINEDDKSSQLMFVSAGPRGELGGGVLRVERTVGGLGADSRGYNATQHERRVEFIVIIN